MQPGDELMLMLVNTIRKVCARLQIVCIRTDMYLRTLKAKRLPGYLQGWTLSFPYLAKPTLCPLSRTRW